MSPSRPSVWTAAVLLSLLVGPSGTQAAPSKRSALSTVTSGWTYQGCFTDGSTRALPKQVANSNSVNGCIANCQAAGYAVAGIEYGAQCWCGTATPTTATSQSCSYSCGSGGGTCGGYYAMDVYKKGGTAITPSSTTTTTSAAATSTYFPIQQQSLTDTSLPSSSGTKAVYAHHMVGNTYSYTQATWADDIALAYASGIDGFALNMGSDPWQSARVADAYAAAKASGTGFKLFFSFDMTSLPCTSPANGVALQNFVKKYASHSNQAMYKNLPLSATFGGEYCTFGQSSVTNGWNTQFKTPLKSAGTDTFFIPTIFTDPSTFSANTWMDGELNWDGGWPAGKSNLDTSSDTTYMNALGSKAYMAAVSPAFFTYYGPNSYNKNWLYRGDNWLLATRFEAINEMRNKFDLVELLTWNDYGESSYVGPIRADQPNSQGWTNGMPHTAFIQGLIKYYATAFKTGSYPAITSDQVILWARPHAAAAIATAPTNPKTTGWENTDDNVYGVVMASAPAKVTLTSGANTYSYNVPKGLTRISIASSPGTVSMTMERSGKTIKNYNSAGSFTYTKTPKDYNYNYWAQSI